MRQVLVPRGQHPPCQLPVDRVPGHRGPVDVPYQHAAARAKCSVHLAERRRYVGDVLEDLNAECPIEAGVWDRSEEHTSELQSRRDLVCRLLLEKKNKVRMVTLAADGGA